MDNSILISAIQYAQAGLPIIACCDYRHLCHTDMERHNKMCRCQGKIPLIKWREKTETSPAEVIQWRDQFQEFNVGLGMGSVTGYIGIDVDGPGGEALLNQMANGNEIPITWKFNTGDGYRLLYQIPVGFKTKKYKLTDPDHAHSECAILCEGQYSIIPPSMHHSGKRYEWVNGYRPDMMDCTLAPNWILDLIREERKDAVVRSEQKVEQIITDNVQSKITPVSQKMADFEPVEFTASLPLELFGSKTNEVKKSSEKPEVKKRSWQHYLEGDVINEGGRDDAMLYFIGSLLSEQAIRTGGKDIARMYIDRFNNEKLNPPLEPDIIEVKLESLWEKEMLKSAEFKAKANEKVAFNPFNIAQVLKNTLDDNGLTYTYDVKMDKRYYFTEGKGPWKEDIADINLHTLAQKYMIEQQHTDWITTRNLREIVSRLQLDGSEGLDHSTALFVDNAEDKMLQRYLPVDGHLLDWKTGEIIPWQADFFSLSNFDIGYDESARCPNWEMYMEQWLPDKGYRDFLQEFLGNAMLAKPDSDGRFVILVGTGANGKSVCLDTIEDIFGSTMSTSQDLSRLVKDQFGQAKLYGMRLNICSELSNTGEYLKDADGMKRLVTGETMNIERKGKDGFAYKPIASHIFSCNAIPKVKDKSDGWFRRQVVIPFDQKFKARADIAEMMNRNIKAERAGIFNWLLEGLRRKTERGQYIIPDSLQEYQDQIKRDQNPVLNFCSIFLRTKEHCSKDEARKFVMQGAKYAKAKHGISANLLYEVYKGWYHTTVSDKQQAGITIASFKQQMKEQYGISSLAQCNSIGRTKMTSVLLGIDFTYSDEMLECVDRILDTDALNKVGSAATDLLCKLPKWKAMIEDGTPIPDDN